MTITKAYQTDGGYEVHYDDGRILSVPDAGGNRHKTELDEWIAAGNSFSTKTKPKITNEQVNEERSRRVVEGTTVNVLGHGNVRVTGRVEDQINIQGLTVVANMRVANGDTTTETTYRDGNNVDHQLTPLQVIDLYSKSVIFIDMLYRKSWELKAKATIPQGYKQEKYWTDEAE